MSCFWIHQNRAGKKKMPITLGAYNRTCSLVARQPEQICYQTCHQTCYQTSGNRKGLIWSDVYVIWTVFQVWGSRSPFLGSQKQKSACHQYWCRWCWRLLFGDFYKSLTNTDVWKSNIGTFLHRHVLICEGHCQRIGTIIRSPSLPPILIFPWKRF